jgi:hypothetical protein
VDKINSEWTGSTTAIKKNIDDCVENGAQFTNNFEFLRRFSMVCSRNVLQSDSYQRGGAKTKRFS